MSEPFEGTAAGRGYGKAFSKAQLVPVFDKCKTCREVRKKEFYSENQLNELRYKLYRGGNQVNQYNAMIKCKMCTGFQANEMLCSVCGEVKMLNAFAKAQRHNPDNARCKDCIQFIADTEPGLEVPSQDDESDFSGEEYDIPVVLTNSLKGLGIRAAEPSDDASVSGGKSEKSDITTLEDKNSVLEGKRPLHGSVISRGARSINTMVSPHSTENKGFSKADSVTSSASFLGGGVALPNSTDKNMRRIAATGDRGDLQNDGPFFTAFDNEDCAFFRQGDRPSRGGKSVSEFSELSKGGWGKVKTTENLVSSWMGERDPAKPNEQIQKKPVINSTSYFKKAKGKAIGVDEDGNSLPEL
ncbi:MAG: hypothetical protein M1840_003058 [Geoglossum simile]|nr:MAG: hypothetical protein M1840_003058 [Geoglossum simile]